MKHIISIFILLFLLTSCNKESENPELIQSEDIVRTISVMVSDPGDSDGDLEGGDIFANSPDILNDNKFEEDKSKLYISQKGYTINPNFGKYVNDNLYTYIYNGNENATWNSGYNFKTTDSENSISWRKISENGASSAGYTLFGMYFPEENNLPETTNVFNVQTDQSTVEGLRKSNILGAFHATSTLYTPLRFRLFHLTVFLDVYVYIPVYNFEEEEGYTGFMHDAFQNAYAMGVNPNFTIDWSSIRPSDIYPPFVNLYGEEKKDIPLYLYRDENNYPIIEEKTIEIPNSYVGNIYEEGSFKEKVYVYHFSVLFPPQGDSFPASNFLQFKFKTPGGSVKTYNFNGALQTAPGGNLGMTQGTYQQLNLYLSRYGADVVLVKAKVMPWIPAFTDMNIVKESDNQ